MPKQTFKQKLEKRYQTGTLTLFPDASKSVSVCVDTAYVNDAEKAKFCATKGVAENEIILKLFRGVVFEMLDTLFERGAEHITVITDDFSITLEGVK